LVKLKKRAVVLVGIIAIVVAYLLIQPRVTGAAEKYRVGNLVVTSPGGTRPGDWNKLDHNETRLTFAASTKNNTHVIDESIMVRYQKGIGTIPSEGTSKYLSQGKANLASAIGYLLQQFVQEGFEAKNGSFTEIAGTDAYRSEFVKHEVPTEYVLYIVIWKEDWYLITYTSRSASPGAHLPDFERLLVQLEFV